MANMSPVRKCAGVTPLSKYAGGIFIGGKRRRISAEDIKEIL